jgi:hypothetical protein
MAPLSHIRARMRIVTAKFVKAVRILLFRSNRDEVEAEAIELRMDEQEERERGGDSTPESDRWLDSLEGDINENSQRSIDNRVMLERLDFRTVWILRFLLMIAGAFATRFLLLDLGLM